MQSKNRKPKSTVSHRIANLFKKIDFLGEEIGFKIEGSNQYNSILGTVISLIVISFVLRFTIIKYTIMTNVEDTSHQTTKINNDINISQTFGADKTNFNMAFGMFNVFTGEVLDPKGYPDFFQWKVANFKLKSVEPPDL